MNIYKLTVRTANGTFYESHTHHSQAFLNELAELYQLYGHTTTIEHIYSK